MQQTECILSYNQKHKQIEAKLFEAADHVFYGSADDLENNALWNYIVFWRDSTKRNDNKTSFTDYYTVAIVQENWVADELIEQVITLMESLSGMRLANSEIDFNYSRKPGTNAVIEIATLTFSRPRKKG